MEMVLGYLRTEDMASDIRFEEVDMDSLIREQIHKFARIFIGKKLSLEYQEVSETVLTDGEAAWGVAGDFGKTRY